MEKVGYLRTLLAGVLTSEMFIRRLKIELGPVGDNPDFNEALENNEKNKKMFLEEAEQYPDALRILEQESLRYGYTYLVPGGEDDQIVKNSPTLRSVIPDLIAEALHKPPSRLGFESERGGKRSRKRKRKLNKNKIKSSKRRRIVKNKRKSR